MSLHSKPSLIKLERKNKTMTAEYNKLLVTCGLALSTVLLVGCGGKGSGSVAPDSTANRAATEVAPQAPARASVPAGAQFAVATETPESLLAMTESAACSLENVMSIPDNGVNPGDVPNSYKTRKGKAYKMIGFAINKDSGTVPTTIRLVLVGAQVYGMNTVTGSERPDVGTYFNNSTFSNAGYKADAAFDEVVPGDYRVMVLKTDGATPVACSTHQTISIQ